MLGAVLVSCLYSAQQYENLISGFQVQFPLVYCASMAALFALLRAEERRRRDGRGWPWIAASIALVGVATYSMSNGLLGWPVLLLAAFWWYSPMCTFAVAIKDSR